MLAACLIAMLLTPGQGPETPQLRLVAQLGHSAPVRCATFSPDGSQVVSASEDSSACVWDSETGRVLFRLVVGGEDVTGATYSPDGLRIVTASSPGPVRVWDVRTGVEVSQFGHDAYVTGVSYSRDGSRILTASDDTARVWDSKTYKELARLVGHEGGVRSASFSPDGSLVVTVFYDDSVRVCDSETGKELYRLVGHGNTVTCAAYSPDGSRIVTASYDDTARVWDSNTGKELFSLVGHLAGVNRADYSPDGLRILTASTDKTARVWDAKTGKELFSLVGHGDLVTSANYSRDGTRIVTASSDGTARVWDALTGREVVRLVGEADQVRGASFSLDGSLIVTASNDKTAGLWNAITGRKVMRLVGHADSVRSVSFSPDGSRIVTASDDRTARVWDSKTGEELFPLVGHENSVVCASFSPDGSRIVTASYDGIDARVWNSKTGGELFRLSHGNYGEEITFVRFLTCASFSPDGLRIVTAGLDRAARVWDSNDGKELFPLLGHQLYVNSASFSPDGLQIVTASDDWTARVWDAKTGKELFPLVGHDHSVISASYSPDGTRIVTASHDDTARVWDSKSGMELFPLVLHIAGVNSAEYSPDGARIITPSDDGTVRVWDARTGAELCSLISFGDGGWAVATPDGHFDTDSVEEVKGLHWIASDQPFTPLGIEVFMRQYYEPKLLARILRGERLPEVKNILDLNRVQPFVEILEVKENAGSETASIMVKVAKATGTFEREGKEVVVETSAHDLRLFRDGRLVRHVEGELIHEGQASRTFVFEDVPLPRGEEKREVRFTAYCFNDDDVKSLNANATLEVAASNEDVSGKVFAICFGADDYDGDAVRDLKYAAADARAFQKTFAGAFTNHERISEVVSISFVSETEGAKQATKENFKAALDLLCGRQASSEVLERAPDLKKLTKATPDDIVIVTFSGHGVSGDDGKFYLVPSNIKSKETLREDSISSDELSEWFRDLDALEMAFILDACHSAKAIEQEGFKPGPMGARGLGQLAYDKGMFVLAATQAEDVALEVNKLQHGLLTYALVVDGYIAGKAKDDQGLLTLQGWLKYAESRVPEIYAALAKGEDIRGEDGRAVIFSGSTASMKTREDLQRPSLFDFLKTRPQIEMVQATTGDVWTPIWGLFVNNASVLSDGAAFDEAVVEFWRRVVMNSIAWSRRSA